MKDISGNRIVIPISILLSLILTGLTLWFHPMLLSSAQPMNPLWGIVEGWRSWLYQGVIINYLITLVAAWGVFKINESFSLSHYRNYLPFLFYLLMQVTNPALQFISEGSLTALLGMGAIAVLFASYQRESASEHAFWVGLLLGTLSLFWTKALLYVPIFILGFWFMRSWRFKIFLALLFGLAAPFWMQFARMFFKGEQPLFLNQFKELSHFVLNTVGTFPPSLQINLGVTFLLAMIAGSYLLVTNIREKVRTQACFNFLILLSILSGALCIADSSGLTGNLTFFYISVAFLASNIFLKVQTKSSVFLFLLITCAYFTAYGFSLWGI